MVVAFPRRASGKCFRDARQQYSRRAALPRYRGCPVPPQPFDGCGNYQYWAALKEKFTAIHAEVQDASRSINKSFGVFNEETLRHCGTNLAQDLEGYKALIARPYESVNRAMPGSYYSDVERTIYLTYYVMFEDTRKYPSRVETMASNRHFFGDASSTRVEEAESTRGVQF